MPYSPTPIHGLQAVRLQQPRRRPRALPSRRPRRGEPRPRRRPCGSQCRGRRALLRPARRQTVLRAARRRGGASTIATCDPSDDQAWPSSTPMTPAARNDLTLRHFAGGRRLVVRPRARFGETGDRWDGGFAAGYFVDVGDREQADPAEAEAFAHLSHRSSIRQQAATCSALSSSSACARSTIFTTRSSAIPL